MSGLQLFRPCDLSLKDLLSHLALEKQPELVCLIVMSNNFRTLAVLSTPPISVI